MECRHRPQICLPSLEDSLCSFHGRPWQGNTWTAWRAWMQIGYSSKRLMLKTDWLPPSYGDPAMKASYTTTLCHRQLRTCPTVDSFPFHLHISSIHSSWASRPLSRATLTARSERAMPLNHTSSSRTTDTSEKATAVSHRLPPATYTMIETGRHKKLEKEARTCPMCAFQLNNPGLPPELYDALIQTMRATGL